MKRKTKKLHIAAPILLAMAMSTSLLPALKPIQAQAATTQPITVMLDGKPMALEQPPILSKEGRVLVPFRAIFEALGAKVDWNAVTNEITAVRGKNKIKFESKSMVAYSNQSTLDLLARPVVINNRTLVSVRFLAETLGADVTWDGATQTVRISGKPLQLVDAVEKGDLAGVKTYLANGGSPDVTVAGTSAVTYALSEGEVDAAQTLLEAGGTYQIVQGLQVPDYGDLEGIAYSQSEMALKPLLQTIKTQQPDTFNRLLEVAINRHDLALLDDLTQMGASIPALLKTMQKQNLTYDVQDLFYNPTIITDEHEMTDLLKAGLDPQIDYTVHQEYVTKGALLHVIALTNHPELVSLAVQNGGKINSTNFLGWTPLMIAAEHGNTAVLQALLQAGADPNVKNTQGLTALDIANVQGNQATAQMLTAAGGLVGTDPNPTSKDVEIDYDPTGAKFDWTELQKDSFYGRTDEVKLLLAQADTAIREDALLKAEEGNNTETVRAILQSGPITEQVFHANLFENLLHTGNNEMLDDILNTVMSLPLSDDDKKGLGVVPMAEFAMENDVPLIRTLLKHGIVPGYSTDPEVINPLAGAAADNATDALNVMLQNGANPPNEPQALAVAFAYGHEQVADQLLKAGADPNITFDAVEPGNDITPLMFAVKASDLDLVQALLQAGADVKAKTSDGTTALSLALSRENQAIIQALQAAEATN